MLQWPCNEPLNALRATSTTKTNCLYRKLFPLPRQKKNNPEVTMERLRYTLYQELRLALRNFSIAQETKQLSRGCSLKGRYCNIWIDFPQKCCTSLAWKRRSSLMSRYRTLNYKARQQESNGKYGRERQNYLP